jgi:hypothetical protein
MFTISNLPQTLRPLILFCQPERNFIAQEAVEQPLPQFLLEPHFAVSRSARQRGWLQPLALKHRVFCEADLESLTLKLELYDLLIVSPLSLNTLAKLALGINDSFPTRVFFDFAALGKPIFISEACLPTEPAEMNPHLQRVYKTHWEALISGTIASFNYDNLETKIVKAVRAQATAQKQINLSTGRHFVTKDDIIAAADALAPLKVPYGTIITDLAKEEAQARNVSIIFE